MSQTQKRKKLAPSNIIEIDFQNLNKYQGIIITECGEENMYFTHEEKKYFCKCF